MSVIDAPSTTTQTDTPLSPSGAQLWRSGRRPAAVVAVVLLAALLIAALSSGGRTGTLDPDSVSPSGSRAVAQLLRGQGVSVDRALGIAAATDARVGDTLVIPMPDLLTVEQAKELASTGADLVVVDASRPEIVEAFAPDLSPRPGGRPTVREPACDLPAALRAGNAETGGTAYAGASTIPDTVSCYPVEGDPTVVTTRTDGHAVTFLGSGGLLENDRLATAGNAALALGLLGTNSRVVWHVVSVEDFPTAPQKTFWQLVPPWVIAALWQVAIAVFLLALWRARRLGPVVVEPLPVVVRASEATEGRGRMYRRAGARDRASAALRSATLSRLRPVLGLSASDGHEAVVAVVAERTGWSATEVAAVLFGGPPTDDAALVRLASTLDGLERQVRGQLPGSPPLR